MMEAGEESEDRAYQQALDERDEARRNTPTPATTCPKCDGTGRVRLAHGGMFLRSPLVFSAGPCPDCAAMSEGVVTVVRKGDVMDHRERHLRERLGRLEDAICRLRMGLESVSEAYRQVVIGLADEIAAEPDTPVPERMGMDVAPAHVAARVPPDKDGMMRVERRSHVRSNLDEWQGNYKL